MDKMPLMCRVPEPFSATTLIEDDGHRALYLGTDCSTNDVVEITLAVTDQGRMYLQHDAMIRQTIGDRIGFQVLHHCASTTSVFECLGPNLKDLLDFCEGYFSAGTVLHVVSQMLSRLQSLMDVSIVHNNISLSAIRIGQGKMGCVFHLVDFAKAVPCTEKASPHADLQALSDLIKPLFQGRQSNTSAIDHKVLAFLSLMSDMAEAHYTPVDYPSLQSQARQLLQSPEAWATTFDWATKKSRLQSNIQENIQKEEFEDRSGESPIAKGPSILFEPVVLASPSFKVARDFSVGEWKESVENYYWGILQVAKRIDNIQFEQPTTSSTVKSLIRALSILTCTSLPSDESYSKTRAIAIFQIHKMILHFYHDLYLVYTYPFVSQGPTSAQQSTLDEFRAIWLSINSKLLKALPKDEACGRAARLHELRILGSLQEIRPALC